MDEMSTLTAEAKENDVEFVFQDETQESCWGDFQKRAIGTVQREDQEIVTFMEEDYENKRDRYLVAKNAFMDDMEDIMDTLPSTQPGFDPRELLTPVVSMYFL